MTTQDFSRFRGRLSIQGTLELITPLRIGAGSNDDMGAADITVVKNALGQPYVPGSSFKGALRSQIEMLLRTLDERLACLCVTDQDDHTCPTTLSRRAPQRQPGDTEEPISPYKRRLQETFGGDEDALYLDGTCRVCQVFGSHGLASKVIIPDLNLDANELSDGQWYGSYQVRHGVSIERDTETAADGRLYTTEAVPAGTRFHCEVIVENGSAADQGVVLLGLRAFERQLATLGGAVSRGLGQVKLTLTDCHEIPDSGGGLINFLVNGQTRPVDEAARLEKIAALRTELRDTWGVQDA